LQSLPSLTLIGASALIIYTLYVKTHRITGLKYLGQTSQDPFTYPGSGIDWIAHLNTHGNHQDTMILARTSDKNELSDLGRYYSIRYNIVGAMDDFGNKIWANRIPETGGGDCGRGHGGYDHTIRVFENIKTREVINSTQREFCDRFNLSRSNVSAMISGNRRHVGDWVLQSNKSYRTYAFYHQVSDICVTMTVAEFIKAYNLCKVSVYAMIRNDRNKKKRPTVKGWSLLSS
jgi:hypothetical protein